MLRLMLPPLRKPVRVELPDAPDSAVRPPASTRGNLIEQIMEINPSASPGFLAQFEDAALARYLDHLRITQQPRGRDARWIRPHGKSWAFAAAACA